MIERDNDLLQWCIEADGLEWSEVAEMGEPGDLERMRKLTVLGFVEYSADGWFTPTARGRSACAPN